MAGVAVLVICGIVITTSLQNGNRVTPASPATAPANGSRPARLGEAYTHRDEVRDASNSKVGGIRSEDTKHGRYRQLTPAEAKRLLQECYQIRNVDERGQACYDVIRDLCRSGYANEAFELIDSRSGEARNSQIAALFGNCGWNFAVASEKMRQLGENGFRGDGNRAFSAYCRSLDLQDFKSLVCSPAFTDYAAYEKRRSGFHFDPADQATATYFADKLIRPETDDRDREAYWQVAKDLHEEGRLTDDSFVRIVMSNRALSPQDKWRAFSSGVTVDAGNEQTSSHRDQIVRDMVNQDARSALVEISKVESPQGTAALGIAIQQWIANDGSDKVAEWYATCKDLMSPVQRDVVANRFFQEALAYGERDVAEQWIQQLADPSVKAEALAGLAKWDEKQVK